MATAADKTAETKGAKTKAATAEFTVVSRLDFDGETYMPGDTVELTEAQALPLIGGAIKVK